MQKFNFRKIVRALLGTTALGFACTVMGQAAFADDADANNPLAAVTAVNFQDLYIADVYDADIDLNQFYFRVAQPFKLGNSNWLFRGTVPLNTLPVGNNGSDKTGLGDIDALFAYQFDTKKPGVSFGIGPQIVAPTGSDKLGSKQWQLGVANVYFNGSSKKVQYGYLAIYKVGVGDTHDHQRVNLGAFQTFLFYQLGNGWYTGGAPIATYDFKNDAYNIPIGARLGKTFKTQSGVVVNTFAEPQFSLAHDGPGQAKWQVFAGLNLQFAAKK